MKRIVLKLGIFLAVGMLAGALAGLYVKSLRTAEDNRVARFQDVRAGMTVQEVIELLGTPQSEGDSIREGTHSMMYTGGSPVQFLDVVTKDGVVLRADIRTSN